MCIFEKGDFYALMFWAEKRRWAKSFLLPFSPISNSILDFKQTTKFIKKNSKHEKLEKGDFHALMFWAEKRRCTKSFRLQISFSPVSNSILSPKKTLVLKQTSNFIKTNQNKIQKAFSSQYLLILRNWNFDTQENFGIETDSRL